MDLSPDVEYLLEHAVGPTPSVLNDKSFQEFWSQSFSNLTKFI